MRPHSRIITPAVAGAGLAATVLVAAVPSLRFAYREPSAHVAIETAAALIASLAAFLVVGRLRETGRPTDLLLALALAVLAAANLGFGVPATAGLLADDAATWGSLPAAVIGATLFACAAFAPERPLRRVRVVTVGAFAVSCALLVALGAVAALLAERVPTGIPDSLAPADARAPLFVGHPVLLALQITAAVLLAAAAVGFARRSTRSADTLLSWVAVAAACGCVARVNYALFPTRFSDWIYTGDAFRLAMYLLLLVGAAREIQSYWRRAADAAVLEERRRIARDLHDGLAQELAFIVAETAGPTAVAAERALDESRRAIAALTRPLDEPLARSIVQAAEEVAFRLGVRVRAEVDPDADACAEVREALVRIVREAVTNAARHGRARQVVVRLAATPALTLEVADDGTGFDPHAQHGGFGLASMRERAAALGGRVRIDSARGAGARIEVALP